MENTMGPNVLWLTEFLSEAMELRPGMRVLDMGCGKAVSSIYLAKEFGVQVWATDLWIAPTDNWRRIREAGVEGSVFPVHAEAHTLPYPHEFFDALISIDAYHYFGTDDLYLAQHFLPVVRPGGQVGIVVPAVAEEFEGDPQPISPSDGERTTSTGAFTVLPGGADTGCGRAASSSRSRICFPTDGGTGPTGMKRCCQPASCRVSSKQTLPRGSVSSATTPAGTSGSLASWRGV